MLQTNATRSRSPILTLTSPANPRLNPRALNTLILDAHRAGCEVKFTRFQSLMLEELQTLIPFDSAWWGNAAADPPEIHHLHLHNCDDAVLRDYPPFMSRDFFRAALIERPGETINLCDLTNRARYVRSELYRNFCKRYRVEWALGTLLVEPVSSLYEFLTLWRHDPRRPFSEAERQAKELLMPHLAQAYRVTRLRGVLDAGEKEVRVWALTDERGFLHEVTPGFIHTLRAHYSDWQGSQLPASLLADIRAGINCAQGPLKIDVTPKDRFRYLEIRPPSAVDRLTSREAEVAQRYARGETHAAIASCLRISPSTVRNHLANCYRKLGVTSKIELANRIA